LVVAAEYLDLDRAPVRMDSGVRSNLVLRRVEALLAEAGAVRVASQVRSDEDEVLAAASASDELVAVEMALAEEAPLAQDYSEAEHQPVAGNRRKVVMFAGAIALLVTCSALACGLSAGRDAKKAEGASLHGWSNSSIVSLKSAAATAAEDDANAGPEPVPAAGDWQTGGTGPSETCPPGCSDGICCGSSCCSKGSTCCDNKRGLCCAATLLCGQAFANDPINQLPQCGGGQQF